MSEVQLTSEQQVVVHHPLGRHARVLAVAGSGKTMTMAQGVKHLIMEQNVSSKQIQVLMFNRLARVQFQERLEHIGVPRAYQPPVDTFHSFAYRLIKDKMDAGLLPNATEFWLDGCSERVWLHTNMAISELEKRKVVPRDLVDPEEAIQAICLWKNSLIPPSRAGYRGNIYIPLVYDEYEQLRLRQNALTFDDFVRMAVTILQREGSSRATRLNRFEHVIVDEYQDVNFGQQRLIELLAGERADVMVVGDDDQTIYEWRGARPNFIIWEFPSVFANKPHSEYTLSRSFRFGPVIAQAANNVISHNTTRVEKRIIAHSARKEAEIHVYEGADTSRELAEQVVSLVKGQGVAPSQIRVLVRTFAQLARLEAEFLERCVPYCVVGREPFFERRENRILMDYLRLALDVNNPATVKAQQLLLNVANVPSRYLSRKELGNVMRGAMNIKASTYEALIFLQDHVISRANPHWRLQDLSTLLDRTNIRMMDEPRLSAGDLLRWLVDSMDYLQHFANYYGDGYESFDRKRAILNFLDYATGTGLRPVPFINHIDGLDTTRGAPEDQQIILTTVFRTKGLEYDYVFIPDCLEGYMPCLRETGNLVFDKAALVEEPEPSEAIENERRLFYVALTRARKAVFIGTAAAHTNGADSSQLPSRFLDEIQLEPTVRVMGALQRLASGDRSARGELLSAVRHHGGIRKIARNLISEYLKDVGDRELIGDVSSITETSPDVRFAYRSAYELPSPTPLHRVWDDVRF